MVLVSIIIPTKGERPLLLRRAVESACLPDEDMRAEIIVVLNGPGNHDDDINSMAASVSRERKVAVNVLRIGAANVSRARNAGLKAARGALVRFLDDDDFLFPDTAREQCLELLASHCDLSTYAGRIEDDAGVVHQTIAPQASMEYGCAVLGPNCPALTFATVYRTDLVRDVRWNECFGHTEDEDWMRQVLMVKDPAWVTSGKIVGAWYQHPHARLSKPVPVPAYYQNRATSILSLIQSLQAEERLSPERREAAARGLWSAIHGGFYFSPIRWTQVARHAAKLDARARPAGRIFSILPNGFSPIVVEWLVLPKRWLNQAWRIFTGSLLGWNSVRRIQ